MAAHCLHNGLWIIDMFKVRQFISVIPVFCFCEIHPEAFAQFPDLRLGKTGVFLENALVRHGIFRKHVKRGMLSVFLNGKNARHIGKGHIGLVFQEITQKVEVLLLEVFRLLPLAHHTVPFVNQENKFFAGFRI